MGALIELLHLERAQPLGPLLGAPQGMAVQDAVGTQPPADSAQHRSEGRGPINVSCGGAFPQQEQAPPGAADPKAAQSGVMSEPLSVGEALAQSACAKSRLQALLARA